MGAQAGNRSLGWEEVGSGREGDPWYVRGRNVFVHKRATLGFVAFSVVGFSSMHACIVLSVGIFPFKSTRGGHLLARRGSVHVAWGVPERGACGFGGWLPWRLWGLHRMGIWIGIGVEDGG